MKKYNCFNHKKIHFSMIENVLKKLMLIIGMKGMKVKMKVKSDMTISKDIIHIGASDKNIKIFENQYVLENGMSYNSYVIKDKKNVILDTIDEKLTDKWLENLEKALEGEKPDYLIVSHMEPDHAYNIGILAKKYPEMKIVGNQITFNMLANFFKEIDFSNRKFVVMEGDVLDIGNHKLQFFMAPMVHWPEVMVTYEQTEKILFSADGFGKFGAIEPEEEWDCEARRYYFGIVGKYGMQVQALLKKAANLDIQMICPLHGPILKDNLGYYIDKYNTWSSYKPEEEGIYIACSSIYGNTLKTAEKLAEILKEKGAKKVVLGDLTKEDWAKAVGNAFKYSHLIVASSSYNAGVFPPMKQFLDRLKERNYQNRTVGIIENGSWAPSAGKCMKNVLQEMKDINIIEPIITIKSTMSNENIAQMEEMADKIL